MPKVTIKEVDLTSPGSPEYDDNIVLIPGECTGSKQTEEGFEAIYKDADTFYTEIIGVNIATASMNQRMAYELLKLGMTVHYVVIESAADMDDDFWSKYSDKGLYNIRFFTLGGFYNKSLTEKMIACACLRGDAIALVDVPSSDADSLEDYIDSLEVDVSAYTDENPFKYAAAFGPHFKYDGNDTNWINGSFAYLACFAKHSKRFSDWFAMAGSVRGVLPFTGVSVSQSYGSKDIDQLQDRTTAGYKAVNVIANIRPYGNIVWGNRTLFPLKEKETGSEQGGLTASSFLNIRNLCCDIKKVLYRAGRKYTFDPNSDVLWTNFKSEIIPLLEEMRSGQGIRGYKIVKEATNQKATLKARITIIPIEAVEDFDLTLELSDSIEVTEA